MKTSTNNSYSSILFAATCKAEIRLPNEAIYTPHVTAKSLRIYTDPETYSADSFMDDVDNEAEWEARKYGRLATLQELQDAVEYRTALDMLSNACYYAGGVSLTAEEYDLQVTQVMIDLCNRAGVIPMKEAPYFRLEVYLNAAIWLAEALLNTRKSLSLSKVWTDLTEDAQERILEKTVEAFIASAQTGIIPAVVKIDDSLIKAFIRR